MLWTGHGWPLAGEPITDSLPTKDVPKPADLIGKWKHTVDYTREYEVELLPNGKVNDPKSKAEWILEDSTLFIKWPNKDAPEGAWLDECYIASDGKSYIGRNQAGQLIRGVRED
jgi:hypothetical protein